MTPHPQFPLFPLALLIDVHDTNPSQIALLRHETELPDPVQVDNLFRLLLAQKVPVHLRMWGKGQHFRQCRKVHKLPLGRVDNQQLVIGKHAWFWLLGYEWVGDKLLRTKNTMPVQPDAMLLIFWRRSINLALLRWWHFLRFLISATALFILWLFAHQKVRPFLFRGLPRPVVLLRLVWQVGREGQQLLLL